MVHKGRLRPKQVPFPCLGYLKGGVRISLVEVYERVGQLISRPLVKGNEDAGYDSEGREI